MFLHKWPLNAVIPGPLTLQNLAGSVHVLDLLPRVGRVGSPQRMGEVHLLTGVQTQFWILQVSPEVPEPGCRPLPPQAHVEPKGGSDLPKTKKALVHFWGLFAHSHFL